jgi:hypothetical protein
VPLLSACRGAFVNPFVNTGWGYSAVESEPAKLVAQPLVVEDEFPDFIGELGALPLALQAAGHLALAFSR